MKVKIRFAPKDRPVMIWEATVEPEALVIEFGMEAGPKNRRVIPAERCRRHSPLVEMEEHLQGWQTVGICCVLNSRQASSEMEAL